MRQITTLNLSSEPYIFELNCQPMHRKITDHLIYIFLVDVWSTVNCHGSMKIQSKTFDHRVRDMNGPTLTSYVLGWFPDTSANTDQKSGGYWQHWENSVPIDHFEQFKFWESNQLTEWTIRLRCKICKAVASLMVYESLVLAKHNLPSQRRSRSKVLGRKQARKCAVMSETSIASIAHWYIEMWTRHLAKRHITTSVCPNMSFDRWATVSPWSSNIESLVWDKYMHYICEYKCDFVDL